MVACLQSSALRSSGFNPLRAYAKEVAGNYYILDRSHGVCRLDVDEDSTYADNLIDNVDSNTIIIQVFI